jgi:thiosulfate/3-mercaptopyruvate sulfurtransferase
MTAAFTTLITASELAALLAAEPKPVVIDTSFDLADTDSGAKRFRASHLPGSHYLHLDRDLSAAKTGRNGRHPLPSPEALTKLFSRLGVTAGKQVVVYDAAQNMYAGRLWWTLKWLGHEAVALLDGSLSKWKAEGRALTTAAPSPKPSTFIARPNNDMKVDAAFVAAHLQDRSIIDARAPDRFDGSAETVDPVGGHIPGALNRFWKSNINPDGSFKSAAELRAEFEALLAGRKPEQVIQQCGSGVTACHNLVAMEIAGLPGSKLYPGSWSEWSSDPARPMVKGGKL